MKKLYLTLFFGVFISFTSFAFQVNEFNLKVGDAYQIKVNQSQEISQMVMGAPNNINTENESLELLEVESVSSNGIYQLKLTVLEQKTVVASPMMSLVEDTENPDIGSGLYPALKNTFYTFSMSSKGEILNVDGLDDVKSVLASRLSENAQAAAQIEALYNEDFVRSTLEQRFSFFPKSGETKWSDEKTMTMNDMPIEMKTDFSYENNSTIKAISNITVEAKTTQMGTNVDLNLSGSQNATYTLNEVTGFPTSFESLNNVSGNATAMGMQIPMTINTDTKTTFIIQK